jgi:uracil-DNA glycosylase
MALLGFNVWEGLAIAGSRHGGRGDFVLNRTLDPRRIIAQFAKGCAPMSHSVSELIEAVRREAERAEFPIDATVYQQSERDTKGPILFAGSLDAPLCVVGRDLGKDEVRAGQPLIGAAGRLVRSGIARVWGQVDCMDDTQAAKESVSQAALHHALLTNLVPYKPPGNKAYPEAIRQRFRPFLERLLVAHWAGNRLITLGSEAFRWFEPYADSAAFQSLGASDARFEAVFHCQLPGGAGSDKTILVYPLPHPSPLNRRWYSQFPAMLARRLAEIISSFE